MKLFAALVGTLLVLFAIAALIGAADAAHENAIERAREGGL